MTDTSKTQAQRTPLYDEHLRLNAKMVPFGGWVMPLQYGQGILAEHQSTRRDVSLFDTCHMGEFIIDGDARSCGLDRIVTQNVVDMPLKTCRYGLMLNEQGGVMDDLIVYRLAEQKWMIVVNAGTMEKDEKHFRNHLTDKAVFSNISFKTGKIDVQGPRSRDFLKSFIEDIDRLDYYSFDTFGVEGEEVIVSRTGYTGELGYEIYYPWDKTAQLWRTFIDQGAHPAGLGVRDVLRIEMAYSLYGHEINDEICPLDAGLAKFIDQDKDFLGKAALQTAVQDNPGKKLVCLVSATRRSPRAGHCIMTPDGQFVGEVTSGTFSPSLNKGIALGIMLKSEASLGRQLVVGDDKIKIEVEVCKRPIYQQGSFKN